MQFCLDPLPHFHHNITPVGLQLAACARQPRLVGHRGRREKKKLEMGWGIQNSWYCGSICWVAGFGVTWPIQCGEGEGLFTQGDLRRGITEPEMLVE